MDDLRAYEVLPIEPASDMKRKHRTWILKKKLKKKVIKKIERKVSKKHKVDIYI